jgi:hypothetical protein
LNCTTVKAGAERPKEKTDRVELLKEAAASPLDAIAIGVTVDLGRLTYSDGSKFKFTVSIDAGGLTFLPSNGATNVRFAVWAGQYSKEGDSLAGIVKTPSANLGEYDYQRIRRAGGLKLTLEDTLKHGAAELRVVVRDLGSGALGSVRVPLRP